MVSWLSLDIVSGRKTFGSYVKNDGVIYCLLSPGPITGTTFIFIKDIETKISGEPCLKQETCEKNIRIKVIFKCIYLQRDLTILGTVTNGHHLTRDTTFIWSSKTYLKALRRKPLANNCQKQSVTAALTWSFLLKFTSHWRMSLTRIKRT